MNGRHKNGFDRRAGARFRLLSKLSERAERDQAPAVHQADTVTISSFVKIVRRDDDDHTCSCQDSDQLPEPVPRNRIDA